MKCYVTISLEIDAANAKAVDVMIEYLSDGASHTCDDACDWWTSVEVGTQGESLHAAHGDISVKVANVGVSYPRQATKL